MFDFCRAILYYMEIMDQFRIAMWIIAAASVVVTVVLGLILGYDLIKFSMDRRVATMAIITYSIVSLILILIMFAMTPAY